MVRAPRALRAAAAGALGEPRRPRDRRARARRIAASARPARARELPALGRPAAPLRVPAGLRADDAHFDALHEGFTTNSLGFRDVEFPLAKPAGEIRILALGDSTTAGNGVPELAHTWPKHLERRFAASGRPELRVLNLGVGGYQPLQEARLFELRGLALEPDLVLVLVSLNDLDWEADGGIGQMLEQTRGSQAPASSTPFALLTRFSRLAFVVAHRARALGFELPLPDAATTVAPVRELGSRSPKG